MHRVYTYCIALIIVVSQHLIEVIQLTYRGALHFTSLTADQVPLLGQSLVTLQEPIPLDLHSSISSVHPPSCLDHLISIQSLE
jgi:hypothetical protein